MVRPNLISALGDMCYILDLEGGMFFVLAH
jgi:hypothetical protein